MDEVKTTPPSQKPKSKKVLIIVIAILLVAAAGASYYVRNRSETDSKATPSEQEDPAPNEDLSVGQITEIQTRYEQTKDALKDLEGKSETDRRTLYSSAAFDGAQLNDPEAKNYALEALKLIEAETNKDTNKDFAGYLDILTEISKGNYKPAQGVVNAEDVEQP